MGKEHVRGQDAASGNQTAGIAPPRAGSAMPTQPDVSSDPVAAYLRARAVSETFKAKTAQLEYEERAGKLIQATKAGEYAAHWSAIVGDALSAYQHYAYKDQDFYRGLCSESRIIRSSGKVEWVPDKSVRNEPLDLAVLCRAPAAVCGIDRFTDDDWAELEGIAPATAPKTPTNDEYWGGRGDFWGPRGGGGNWFK